MHDFHGTFRDLLHAANVRHGTHGFTSLPKEGVLRIFSVVLLNKKIHVLLSQVYCVRQVVNTPTTILNDTVFYARN